MSKALETNFKQNYEEIALQGATESVRKIYSIIAESNIISAQQIIGKSTYSSRTVRYAIKVLLDLQLIKKIPFLEDCRVSSYKIV